jgi:hypothetical protein
MYNKNLPTYQKVLADHRSKSLELCSLSPLEFLLLLEELKERESPDTES